ncbi:DNA-directed RNA polymerase subunit omega [Pirellula sp. SH-Sr6A]|uniref:DNA-directed RNA polymerase subunit omega n=1 Tax=Pirellula sp. SH-Sr6A TaxID=1632865 RepID=UPI00078C61CC|nr:DNA-directed RNA polymerase subunit omega [Pirellula sp. SH-Sr6A]AMV30798.1 DNA-directed RNA polymerase subunit omega [Pirellula sp. SH-Sr6A]
MLEELKEEAIVNKVGGRFKLSTLIQKRLVQLNRGSRPLVDMNSDDKMEIVIHEILQDKIFLTTNGELKILSETADLGELLDLDSGDL